jgi:putative tricarboxylic transport membrane protein
MNRYDSITSLIWFLVGLGIIFWSSITLKIGTLRQPGGGVLPLFCGIVISILSIIVFFQSKVKTKEVSGESFFIIKSLIKILYTIGILIVYALVLERLGFIITTFIVMLFIFKQIARASYFIGILESLITTGICYYIFSILLKISLPRGWLGI